MKYLYAIEINTPSSRRLCIEYRYGSVRGIKLSIGKRGARICFSTNRLHDATEILSEADTLVMDAIKKACLIYALVNGKSLDIQHVNVLLNGERIVTEAFTRERPLVYSMLSGKLGIEGIGLDDPALLNQLANTPKSKNDRTDAALTAYLVARTRTYRIERFIYLWMAVNAVYALAAEEAAGYMKTAKGKEVTRPSEKDGLRLVAAMYNMEYPEIRKENEKRIMAHAFSIAKHRDIMECVPVMEDTLRGTRNRVENNERYEVRSGEFEEYDWIALMLFWLPYRLRCRYFHSENTIPIFCYEDEHLLQGLSFVNILLEHFLSLELAKWVTDEKRKAELTQRAQMTASAMVFGR